MASAPKTRPTDADPVAYCAALPTARRRAEGTTLMTLFEEVTGAPSVMWGPSMIGYGSFPYTSAKGHCSSDWFIVGFSPRRAAISLYGLQSAPGAHELLEHVGKHRTGAGCMYVNGLADIDLDMLRELVALAWASEPTGC